MTMFRLHFFAFVAFTHLVVVECSNHSDADELPADRPNIVFILADDLGWSELGCYGNRFNETPNLDRMARHGLRFTNAYAAAPVCSPYRASLLTGQSPARHGILDYLRPNSANALSTQHVTLPEVLQAAGYATGMIGKWHLSGYVHHGAEYEVSPRQHGFHWNFAREIKGVANGVNFWPYLDRKTKTRWLDLEENRLGENEFLVDRMNHEAVNFVRRNRDRPFFLYLSHFATHSIVNGKPKLVQKYRDKHPPGSSSKDRCVVCSKSGRSGCPEHHWAQDHNPHLAAMLESIDDGVGMIVDQLRELDLGNRTIVVFTSDNGGETNVTSNQPLRGGKSQLYEGGIRIPLLVRWPTRIPEHTVTDQVTVNTDFYPTLLDAAGIAPDPKRPLDGISLLSVWQNPQTRAQRDFVAWHYPLDRPHFLGGVSSGAIRQGAWKLIENYDTGDRELYELDRDPSETTNQLTSEPETADALTRRLREWRESVGATIPSPPLLVEPGKIYFADHFHPGLVSDRLWYNGHWVAEDGILKRIEASEGNTRIFLRDAEYKDVMIRFDFRLDDAKDVRLMTGSGGAYNTVIHVRPDHFFVQTARDRSAEYFPRRHGECAFDFDSDKWYTMTVEFLRDEVVAHIDHQHLAYGKHPMIDRTRRYFAIQADEQAVSFDNVQIFQARRKKEDAARIGYEKLAAGKAKYPVKKSLQDQWKIQQTNSHEWYFRNDPSYRELVHRVDELDRLNRERFPEVFQSLKERKKGIAEARKKIHSTEDEYKALLNASHHARRAVESFLIEQNPAVADMPRSRKEAEIERLRRRFAGDHRLQTLVEEAKAAQEELEKAYPQLFVSDEQIKALRESAAAKAKERPEFKDAKKRRADAYRAQREYLLDHDSQLADLQRRIET